ncbi:MAG TPA: DUF4124 domain-containing protein [Usitatibacter sp.]|nr:DUF4124 domain-containing protein [Usitatibacter sp.]
MTRLFVSLVALAVAPAFAGDIVRCVAANGAITYQQSPCPGSANEKIVGIPSEYPAPNLTERDRLLAREAELYKRLEARREREVKEVALREARLEREAELERARLAALSAAQQPQYFLVYPPRAWPPHRPPVRRTLATR